jgi:hypothetical protein
MTAMRYGMAPPFIIKGMGMAVVSLIYPGVVLAIMTSAAVRDYYRSVGEPMWLFSPQRRAAWALEFAEILGSAPGRAGLWAFAAAGTLAARSSKSAHPMARAAPRRQGQHPKSSRSLNRLPQTSNPPCAS